MRRPATVVVSVSAMALAWCCTVPELQISRAGSRRGQRTRASAGLSPTPGDLPHCQHVSYACELMRLDSDFSAVSDELQKDRNKLP